MNSDYFLDEKEGRYIFTKDREIYRELQGDFSSGSAKPLHLSMAYIFAKLDEADAADLC